MKSMVTYSIHIPNTYPSHLVNQVIGKLRKMRGIDRNFFVSDMGRASPIISNIFLWQQASIFPFLCILSALNSLVIKIRYRFNEKTIKIIAKNGKDRRLSFDFTVFDSWKF